MMSTNDSGRREVIQLINEWNSSRYELFALSEPNENLEFHGVMRFFFQDAGEKVATKCIRVESTASTDDIIKVLIEKFRPDMKSLSTPKDYAIYETHADGVERKLSATERPLWIQLDWGKEGREGRFLLKNENAKTVKFDTSSNEAFTTGPVSSSSASSSSYKRRFSRKDKKEPKDLKQQVIGKKPSRKNVAENLYKEVPDSKFTRSISNPEAVMARRRQQKLESKLQQIQMNDGGGTLKVYGETLKPDIPYKTILMSNKDTAAYAVREILEKYGMSDEDVDDYCLVQVITPTREERELNGTQIKEIVLDDNESPLNVLMHTPCVRGTIIFQIRKCAPQMVANRKARKKMDAAHRSRSRTGQDAPPGLTGMSQMMSGSAVYENDDYLHTPMNSMNMSAAALLNRSNTLPPKAALVRQIHAKSINLGSKPDHPSTTYGDSASNYDNIERRRHLARTESLNRTYLTRRNSSLQNYLMLNTRLPCLVELAQDGYDLQTPTVIQIKSDFYEIGNDKLLATTHPNNYIRLPTTPGIEKKHCALKKSNDNLQLLLVPYAETYVNEILVKEPTQLFNNCTVRLGKYALYRLENPNENSNLIVAHNNSTLNPMTSSQQYSHMSSSIYQQQQQQQQQPVHVNTSFGNYGMLYESGSGGGLAFENLQSNHNYINASLTKLSLSNIPQGTVHRAKHVGAGGQTAPMYNSFSPLMTSMNNLSRTSEGLPGLLEFPDDCEDTLLAHICNINATTPSFSTQFKLAPAYTMYMMLRYRLSQKYKNELLTFNEKLASSAILIHKMVSYVREAVSAIEPGDKPVMVYWLANASELLSFLKQDVHLANVSLDAQSLLAESVHAVYTSFVVVVQRQLDQHLAAFFDPSEATDENTTKLYENTYSNSSNNSQPKNMTETSVVVKPTLTNVLQTLDEAMNLLRGSRVNAAFTIQLYSQLFHYISSWLFNTLTSDNLNMMGYCSQYWGAKLFRRVNKIHAWSEKHGLELAANNHLSRIIQAAFFLKSPKHDTTNLSMISSNCFGLNSAQIAYLVEHYYLDLNEQLLSQQLCSKLIAIARNTADELLRQEGRPVTLHEDTNLHAHAFLFPENGHSSDIVKGLPLGLVNFIMNFQNAGICWLWQNTQSSGNWKQFFSSSAALGVGKDTATSESNLLTPANQAVVSISLTKMSGSLGFSIVAGKPSNSNDYGIYVKSIVLGGAASYDGRLEIGDQILTVNGFSLINVGQVKAAEYLTNCGQVATLQVAKRAAFLNGLDTLLLSPSNKQLQQANESHGKLSLTSPASDKAKRFSEMNHQPTIAANSRYTSLPRNYHSMHGPPTYENTVNSSNSSSFYTKMVSPQYLPADVKPLPSYHRPMSASGMMLLSANNSLNRTSSQELLSGSGKVDTSAASNHLDNNNSPNTSSNQPSTTSAVSGDWSKNLLVNRPTPPAAVAADSAVSQISRSFQFLTTSSSLRNDRNNMATKNMVSKQESICELEEIDAELKQQRREHEEHENPAPESQKNNSPASSTSSSSSASDGSEPAFELSVRPAVEVVEEASKQSPRAVLIKNVEELGLLTDSPKRLMTAAPPQLPQVKLAQQEADDLDTMVISSSTQHPTTEFNLSADCSTNSSNSSGGQVKQVQSASSSKEPSEELQTSSSAKFSPTSSTKSAASSSAVEDSNSNSNSNNNSPVVSLQSIMVNQTNRTMTSPASSQQPKSPQSHKRVMFNETTELVEFERADDDSIIDIEEVDHELLDIDDEEDEEEEDDHSICSLDSPLIDEINEPNVIGANEVYIDRYMISKKEAAASQQSTSSSLEGEKLSFKEKLKLFTKQSQDIANDVIKKRTT